MYIVILLEAFSYSIQECVSGFMDFIIIHIALRKILIVMETDYNEREVVTQDMAVFHLIYDHHVKDY